MKILLYNPDNGVTQNFMPHLWMFLLQSLTPTGHEVLLIDGNTQPMTDAELVQFALDQKIGLVGIGAMTRMIAKAYRVADALRAAGIPVVMGGPHVTEVPDEALGRDGGPRHADAIALGEADETWPRIVADAARGQLKEVYTPVDAFGQEQKARLCRTIPQIPWDTLDIEQFNRIPGFFRPIMQHLRARLGDLSHHPHRVRTRLSLRLRVLHGHGILRRLHPLPHQSEHRGRDCCCSRSARAASQRQDRRLLRGRQFRHQREAHQIAAARHHRGRRADSPGWDRSAPTCCATRNCST